MLSSYNVSLGSTMILCCIISSTIWPPALLISAATVTHLPGFLQGSPLPFHLQTGYVEVDEVHGVELFYYFIESERNPREDPVLLWLTGGPGCSSFNSLVLEIGPLKFKSERYNGSLPNLVYNPYAWTKVSSIIFLDSPIGTGFSFSQNPQGYESGDKSWSKHAEIFLRKWFMDHPEFMSNPLYIAGDSYAAKVVPLVFHYLLNGAHFGLADERESGDRPTLNIQGYMIGNPSTGESVDYNARVPFARGMGIISEELFQSIEKNCKGEISYRNPKNAICATQIQIFEGFTSELMIEHILEPKCKSVKRRSLSSLLLQETATIPDDVKCRTYAHYLMNIWSNNDAVREALHIKKGTVREWVRCNFDVIYTRDISSSIPYIANLTATGGYRALVYSGDHDLTIPFVGTDEWIKSLGFFTADKWRSWHVAGQVAGYTVSYSNNLTFATVKGAGHTAPEYKPRECLAMFQRWSSHGSL